LYTPSECKTVVLLLLVVIRLCGNTKLTNEVQATGVNIHFNETDYVDTANDGMNNLYRFNRCVQQPLIF